MVSLLQGALPGSNGMQCTQDSLDPFHKVQWGHNTINC